MSLATAIAEFRTDRTLADNVVEWRTIPAEPPRFEAWPPNLDPRVTEALKRRGIARPYTHQAQAIDHALAGDDTVVVTPTASGKTLCYNVPVLESILRDPDARALYLFPTKALAQDQLNELHELITEAEIDVKTFTYDGDTSPAERRRVRTAGHVVLTNPDMLHTAILPHHTKWVRLFENLKYIVIDELHTYRGVFGSHVGNVLRRLQRICRFYGAEPTFICCSATIRNPAELASTLTGHDVQLVDDSGAPRGERHVVLYNPPVVNAELGIRRGVIRSATDIASLIQEHGPQTLVFAGSRTNVELLTTYLRELPGGRPRNSAAGDPVRGYRAGYLPKERRAIEAGLRNGDIRTVVGTNALELGIDIGGLDATVVAGYPGTLASLWQQAGRAGRRADSSLAVYIAGSGPLDQYVVNNPDYVFGAPVEAGLIDPDNPLIAAEHLKCAVFELPVDESEHPALGEHTETLLQALEQASLVHLAADRAYWMNEAYPADEISLRSGPDQNVVILDQGEPPVRHEIESSREATVLGEIDPPAARLLVHDQAIYIHDGRQYHVDRLDWEELKAYVHAVDVDYYTDAHLAVDLKVLDQWDGRVTPATHGHGDVSVTYLATLFKKIRLHTHENIGWGKIRLPQDDLHTSAFWLALPDDLVELALANTPAAATNGLTAASAIPLARTTPDLIDPDPLPLPDLPERQVAEALSDYLTEPQATAGQSTDQAPAAPNHLAARLLPPGHPADRASLDDIATADTGDGNLIKTDAREVAAAEPATSDSHRSQSVQPDSTTGTELVPGASTAGGPAAAAEGADTSIEDRDSSGRDHVAESKVPAGDPAERSSFDVSERRLLSGQPAAEHRGSTPATHGTRNTTIAGLSQSRRAISEAETGHGPVKANGDGAALGSSSAQAAGAPSGDRNDIEHEPSDDQLADVPSTWPGADPAQPHDHRARSVTEGGTPTAFEGNSAVEGALHGLGQLLHNVAPLLLMSDPRDLQLATQIKSPHTGRPTVFLWESVPGGVGFSEHLFERTSDLLDVAATLLAGCDCPDGCPACVGPPPAPGLGVKHLVTAALARLIETSSPATAGAPSADVGPLPHAAADQPSATDQVEGAASPPDDPSAPGGAQADLTAQATTEARIPNLDPADGTDPVQSTSREATAPRTPNATGPGPESDLPAPTGQPVGLTPTADPDRPAETGEFPASADELKAPSDDPAARAEDHTSPPDEPNALADVRPAQPNETPTPSDEPTPSAAEAMPSANEAATPAAEPAAPVGTAVAG